MSAQQFLEQLYGDLGGLVANEDQLRSEWSNPETRERFMSVLAQKGYDEEKLTEMRRLIDAPDSDLFDVLAYIRFDLPPLTRMDRAEKVRQSDLDTLTPPMREFIAAILNSYEFFGEAELAATKLAGYLSARFGTTADAKKVLGDIPVIRQTYFDVQKRLYEQ